MGENIKGLQKVFSLTVRNKWLTSPENFGEWVLNLGDVIGMVLKLTKAEWFLFYLCGIPSVCCEYVYLL